MRSLTVATSCLSVLVLVSGTRLVWRLIEWDSCPMVEDDRHMAAAGVAALTLILATASLVAVCQEL